GCRVGLALQLEEAQRGAGLAHAAEAAQRDEAGAAVEERLQVLEVLLAADERLGRHDDVRLAGLSGRGEKLLHRIEELLDLGQRRLRPGASLARLHAANLGGLPL